LLETRKRLGRPADGGNRLAMAAHARRTNDPHRVFLSNRPDHLRPVLPRQSAIDWLRAVVRLLMPCDPAAAKAQAFYRRWLKTSLRRLRPVPAKATPIKARPSDVNAAGSGTGFAEPPPASKRLSSACKSALVTS